jgi:hypothetical protein
LFSQILKVFNLNSKVTPPKTTSVTNIDDIFSTLTVDTAPIVPTTNHSSSNVDDLFKELDFSPSVQPQFNIPMSQTMPSIFPQQHFQQQMNPLMTQMRPTVNLFFLFSTLFSFIIFYI